ncbi:MAG: right-handed parallel beta-helix repeat-containing protein [Faecalibacterium prausnitzii]|nr:right-handed parallel beta-helix repeat-containing protein [Faecalibacterium prausnitzii]
MEGTYAHRVIINTEGDVTIYVTGPIDYTTSITGNVALWQVEKVHDLTIENENPSYIVQTTVFGVEGPQLLREEYNARINKITVNGGIYKNVSGNSAFQFSSGGNVELNNVTLQVEGGSNAIYSNGSCHVEIDGGKYESVDYPTIEQIGSASMTIRNAEMFGRNTTAVENADDGIVEIIDGRFTGNGNRPTMYNCGKRMTVTGATVVGTYVCGIGVTKNSKTIINNSYFNDSPKGIWVRNIGNPKVVLNSATFQNNGCDIYLDKGQTITIEDTFTDTATVKVADSPIVTPRQITTADATGQEKLNLVSNDKDAEGKTYFVAYDAVNNYRYLTPRTGYTVDAKNAKATVDGTTVLDKVTQVSVGTPVTLTADLAPVGQKFADWFVTVNGDVRSDLLNFPTDGDQTTATFIMPKGNVMVKAEYDPVDSVDPAGPSGEVDPVLTGAIVTGAVLVGAYEAGTGIYRLAHMRGIPLPSNRIELAELVWERAGKPEPQNMTDENLYADIDADDTDAQKAAHWMVEQELMKFDEDNNKFHPCFLVSKLRVCLTWQNAKDKGLID